MQNTTSDYKLEITKDNIEVEAKITIGDNIYTSSDVTNLVLEYTQPQEGFGIGNTPSQSLDLTLLNRRDIIYNTSQIKLEIGLKIGSTIEYIPMGIFNIDDVEKTDYTTKFTCYDNMIKFEKTFSTSLGKILTLQQVASELTRITGVEFTGSLPSYTVKKLEGFSCREVLGYVASICGGNAVITRDGKFTIKGLTEVEKAIDGHNIILNNYKTEEVKYKLGQVSCQADENNILSKGSLGTDSMELQFENPWVNESILNDIYNKVKSVEYLGYSMKWTGDLDLDIYDVVSVTDTKNIMRKLPILSQKITCTKGIVSEIGAKGETKNKNSFSSSGSATNKVNRAVMELAVINKALIDKANIRDLEAVSIRTQTLEAKTAKIEEAIIDVAYIKDLNAINASIQNLIAEDARINQAIINKAEITDLTATNIKFDVGTGGTLDLQTLLSKFVTGENGQFLNITTDNVTISNAVIKDIIAKNISVEDLKAGRLSTNKINISSDDGGITIVGPTMQFKDKSNKVRIQMGQDTQGNFNFILRGEDGTTTLIDHTGIKEKAIVDDLIKSNMVAADTIGEKQINYSSLITGLNKDNNTSLIQASKVAIDLTGQSLEVAFNNLKSNVDGINSTVESNTTAISIAQGKIDGLIKESSITKGDIITLKDNYTSIKATVDGINTTVASHTSSIGNLTSNLSGVSGKITKVEDKQSTLEQNLKGFKTTVADTYSTKKELSNLSGTVSTISSKVSTAESSITQLKNQITQKVEATEVNTIVNNAVNGMQIGGRNLVLQAPTMNNQYTQLNTFKGTRTIVNDFTAKSKNHIKIECTTAGTGFYMNVWTGDNSCIGKKYTWSFEAKMNTSKTLGNIGHERGGRTSINVTTEWKKFTCTWTYSSSGNRAFIFYPNFVVGDIIYIRDFKIEEGTKATDFTLAPEDITSDINNVNTKIETTNNKVASIETNLSSITQRVSNTETNVKTINGNISSLQSRMSSAEQKITDSAIINTVQSTINKAKNEAIAGANSSTDTKLKNYTTKASMELTANQLKLDFKSSGGYNLIRNSTGYNGTKLWSAPSGGTMGTTINHNIGGASSVYMYLDNGTKTTESYAYSKRFKLKANTKYTFSGWLHNYTKCPNFDVFLLSSTSVGETNTGVSYTNAKGLILLGNTNGNWKKYSVTFTTPANVISGVIRIDNNGYNDSGTNQNRVHWSALMLTEGEEQPWSPHPSEVYDGNTVIDASGVTINNGALTIKNKAGSTVLTGDSNGDLTLTGNVTNGENGFVTYLNRGGLVLEATGEKVGYIRSSHFTDDKYINGLSIGALGKGDYVDIGYTASNELSGGTALTPSIRIAKTNHSLLGSFTGIQLKAETRIDYGRTLSFQNKSAYDSEIFSSTSGHLNLYGDNGVALGYRVGSTNVSALQVDEPSDAIFFKSKMRDFKDGKSFEVLSRYKHGSVERFAPRITNMNAYLDSGWYSFGPDCSGTPVSWGVMLTIRAFSSDFCQIVHGTNNVLYIRWYVVAGGTASYTPWKVW